MLTSYIANLNRVSEEHEYIVRDMGDRSFPCVISNNLTVADEREFPYCAPPVAERSIENRIITLRSPDLAFFFLFMEDSQRNEIAAFELGLAIQNPNATVVLIGPRPRLPIHFAANGSKLIRAYDYENFVALRFFNF